MQRIERILTLLIIGLIISTAKAASPIFTLTPTTPAPRQVARGSVAETIYRVTNNAPATLSHEGMFNPPASITQITGTGLCSSSFSLASGASCNLEMDIRGDASGGPLICYTPGRPVYCSEPTPANQLAVRIITAGISVPTLVFSTPIIRFLVLTNNASRAVNVTQVQLIRGNLQNVTVNPIPGACQPLAPNASCNVPLIATADASGSARAVIHYTLGGQTTESTTTVSVVNTTVNFTPTTNNEIRLKPNKSNQTITITNTGNFTWKNASVTLASSLANTAVASNTCSGNIVAGANCQIAFTTTGATLGQSTTLDVSGSNIATTKRDITINGGVTVEPDVEAANTHLFYRAVKVENLTPNTIQLTNVAVNNLDNQVKWCQSGDADCDFTSTCQLNTGIASQASCLLWFESEIPSSNPTLGNANGTITVTDNTNNGNGSTTLDANYSLNLYAGGDFDTANGGAVTASRITLWNGTSWNSIIVGANNGVNNDIKTLLVYRGDLYAGGLFTEAGGTTTNRIAYWNGVTWNTLGSGVSGNVRALTSIGNTLYAGGDFTTAGGQTVNRIASWNGSTWNALGVGTNNRIRALTSIGSTLYAGGSFIQAGGQTVNRIASWNGSTWSPLGDGVNNNLHTLASIGNTLYAGGQLTQAGGNTTNRIALWNGSTWSALETGANNTVRALFNFNGTLYMGGNFTQAGGQTVNRIASWNGTTWSALAGGGFNNNAVFAITNLGNTLYAAGTFTNPFTRIASWNGTVWSALGNGLDARVLAIAVAPSLAITAQ